MTCPHCGFENQEGRKYCRGCAKALASEPAAANPTSATADQSADLLVAADAPAATSPSSDSSPVDSSPIDSFGTDSFSTPLSPLGLSRNVIAITAVLVIVIGGIAFWLMQKSKRGHDAQAGPAQNAVAAQLQAASLKNREHVIAALRLIVAQQEARLADDPDDLNVCAVKLFGDDELGRQVRESHYIIDQPCQPRTADGIAIRSGFTVTATPKLEDNPVDAPTYCVDQTKIIRRYAEANEVSNATGVQHLTCPVDGQAVE